LTLSHTHIELMYDSYFSQTLKTDQSRQPVKEWFVFLPQRIAHLSMN